MANIYVDGESHFIRSEACFQKLRGSHLSLASAEYVPKAIGTMSYPDDTSPLLSIDSKCKFFWDKQYIAFLDSVHLLRSSRNVRNAVYFSSVVGSEEELHRVRTCIRQNGFEPQITLEHQTLAKRREAERKTNRLIYKPKGVDSAMSVRLLVDAFNGTFDECFLFTSDVDFVPAIEVVRRLGRKVYVCGYRDGLGKRSALEYVPDRFIDLEERTEKYEAIEPPVKESHPD